MRKSVARLVEAGAIWRKPSRGRHPSTYGFPTLSGEDSIEQAATLSPVDSIGALDPVPNGHTDPVPGGHPYEEVIREDGGGARADTGAGAREAAAQGAERQDGEAVAAFGKLIAKLTGAPPTPRQRAEWFGAYKAAPAGFASVVAEVRAATTARSQVALLAARIRDGAHLAAQSKADYKAPPPCPECEIGGGRHAADCPTLAGAA